jgi:predicted dehydrogenase
VANLTASRVSTEQVRKLRVFQPGEYFSVDYKRQEIARARISAKERDGFAFSKLPVEPAEPLQRELAAFVQAVRQRSRPKVDGIQAVNALRLAEEILVTIKEYAHIVSQTIRRHGTH